MKIMQNLKKTHRTSLDFEKNQTQNQEDIE